MKKGVYALLALSCLPCWSLDWDLPIFTVRYEVAGGGSEDPDEDTLEPSSLRNTVTFHVKEAADPATFGLGLTMSAKDYYRQSGDYSYLRLEHDASFRLDESWKLGYVLGAKWMTYPDLDEEGFSKDALSLSAGTSASVRLARGTTAEAGVGARLAVTENPADAAQAWRASAGISTRFGDWLLAARYRGEFRFPLGSASSKAMNTYNTGSLSLQWDPN